MSKSGAIMRAQNARYTRNYPRYLCDQHLAQIIIRGY